MNKATKLIAATMCLIMLFSSVFPINISAVSPEDFYMENIEENKAVYISPGADDTEMCITWYGGKDGVDPVVKISGNENILSKRA